MAKVPVSEQVQVNFRMPPALRDRIKAAADASGRSMNAEIIARIEATFAPPIDLGEISLTLEEEARMEQIMKSFAQLLAARKERGEDPAASLPLPWSDDPDSTK